MARRPVANRRRISSKIDLLDGRARGGLQYRDVVGRNTWVSSDKVHVLDHVVRVLLVFVILPRSHVECDGRRESFDLGDDTFVGERSLHLHGWRRLDRIQ